MSHTHDIYDTDSHFKIDPVTMNITTESKNLVLGQGDHKSERYTFEIPRYIEGHDMSLCDNIEMHFENKGDSSDISKDYYTSEDVHICESDPETVFFSFLMTGNATKYVGTLSFSIFFGCVDENGNYIYKKHTNVFRKIKVKENIYNMEHIEEEYSDAFEQLKNKVEKKLGTVKTVNGEAPDESGNVDTPQPDFNDEDSESKAFIKNKPLIVTVSKKTGYYFPIADKTVAEIKEAYDAKRTVWCYVPYANDGYPQIYMLTSFNAENNVANFSSPSSSLNNVYFAGIMYMEMMKTEAVILGTTQLDLNLPNMIALTVTISEKEDKTYVSNVTFADIATAYKYKKHITCLIKGESTIFELVSYTSTSAIFQTISRDGIWKTITISSDDTVIIESGDTISDEQVNQLTEARMEVIENGTY